MSSERAPLLEGKSMHITVASIHKPKAHEGPATAGRRDRRLRTAAPVAAGTSAARHRPQPAASGARGRGGTGQRTEPHRPPAPKAAAAPAPAPEPRPRNEPAAPAATAAPAAPRTEATNTDEARRSAHRDARAGTDRRVRPHVPKMKSHKAAQKRIGVTGSGKVVPRHGRGAATTSRSSRPAARAATPARAWSGGEHAAQVRRLLPYL